MWKGLSKFDLTYFDEFQTGRAFRVHTDGAWVLLEACTQNQTVQMEINLRRMFQYY